MGSKGGGSETTSTPVSEVVPSTAFQDERAQFLAALSQAAGVNAPSAFPTLQFFDGGFKPVNQLPTSTGVGSKDSFSGGLPIGRNAPSSKGNLSQARRGDRAPRAPEAPTGLSNVPLTTVDPFNLDLSGLDPSGIGAPSQFSDFGVFESPEQEKLRQLLLSPTAGDFQPRTASQNALLEAVIGQVGGANALRGLGSPTADSLATSVAPALAGFRQEEIGNLQTGAQLAEAQFQSINNIKLEAEKELSQATTERERIAAQLKIQSVDSELKDLVRRQSALESILSAGAPTVLGGQQQTTTQGSDLLGSLIGAGTSLGSAAILGSAFAACWVAEVIYGVDDPRTHAARLYCATHDNWFTRMYKKFGKVWAKFLSNHRYLIPIVRPVWDYMAYRGMQEESWQT